MGRLVDAMQSFLLPDATPPAPDLAQYEANIADRLVGAGLSTEVVALLKDLVESRVAHARLAVVDVAKLGEALAGQFAATAATLHAARDEEVATDPFDVLAVSKLAKALGVSDETVRLREKAGEFFAITNPARKRGRGYPAFQAWPTIAGKPLAAVLAALPGLDGASASMFFSSPSHELAGLTPVEVLSGTLTTPRAVAAEAQALLGRSPAQRQTAVVGAAQAFYADATA